MTNSSSDNDRMDEPKKNDDDDDDDDDDFLLLLQEIVLLRASSSRGDHDTKVILKSKDPSTTQTPGTVPHYYQQQGQPKKKKTTKDDDDAFDILDIVRERANQQQGQQDQGSTMHSGSHVVLPRTSSSNLLTSRQTTNNVSNQQQSQPQPPGAYSWTPGIDLKRNPSVPFSLLGQTPPPPNEEQENVTTTLEGACGGGDDDVERANANQGSLLSVAFEVEDSQHPSHDVVPAARPVDQESLDRRRAEAERQCRTLVRGIVVGVLASLVLIVSLALGLTKNNEKKSLVLPTDNNTKETPKSPSQPTRTLPPMENMKLLYDDLPEKTKESLYNRDSPQYEAWEWLLKHPNIATYPEWKKKQIFAMTTFYYALDGPYWPEPIRKNWLDETKDECSWMTYSVEENEFEIVRAHGRTHFDLSPCNDDGELKILQLELGLNMTKPIVPPEVGFLASLTFVGALAGVNFIDRTGIKRAISDVLPMELAQLPQMEFINLLNNELSGSIPTYIAMMTELKFLVVGANRLTGTIPKEIGALTNLQHLSMGRNSLAGAIPSEMGLMTSLTDLVLRDNSLSGKIPSELGILTRMFRFNLMSNSLSSTIPSELGQLVNTTWLFLQNNAFSGSIPSEVWQLSQLKNVDLSGLPLLSATIPSELCYLRDDETCSFEYFRDDDMEVFLPCKLKFDCTELLCGCDCDCLVDGVGPEMEVTNATLGKNSTH